ncbi:hypothetical protein HPB50_016607 [Hyalomma asiaticum]|uniref:Uncharacterized protein n=1 Tax=Hyalomma asiaticum TaxID=266040 RepID=A0ACB7S1W3_HYAAI|nr:hypothetical protein HPB50_016607 [Hyalomma asiaticum]
MIRTKAVVNGPAVYRFQRKRVSYRRIALLRSFFSKPPPSTALSDSTSTVVEASTGDMPTVTSQPRIQPPPRKRKTVQYLTVPSLQVPLNKSMKNLSCPDLTKIALQNGGGTSDEDMQRAPSLGDSIGDTMSLHSDQGTEDELQFAFKNQKLLRTDRYGEDSDSSDCSHLEMMPVSDDDALHTQSDKSSQNDSSSPKLTMKRPAPRQRRKAPAPQSPLVQNSAGRIPSIKVTCETPALRPHSAEKTTASDWMTAQLTSLKHWFAELQEDFSEWHPVEVPDQPPKDNEEAFSLK